jgi:hypothetical protein
MAGSEMSFLVNGFSCLKASKNPGNGRDIPKISRGYPEDKPTISRLL